MFNHEAFLMRWILLALGGLLLALIGFAVYVRVFDPLTTFGRP
jgi:hypothetical protein